MSDRISAVTITLNEEKNIEKFIKSHEKVADEVIVVDSGSIDGTVEIARRLGAKVISTAWHGYAKQWNIAINSANCEWIIIGDADHVLSDELVEEINLKKQHNLLNKYDAYYVPRKNIMFNKWVRHGGFYPDTPYARLFKKKLGLYDENQLVHEKLIVNSNNIGKLKNAILHYTYLDYEKYIEKMNKYTSLEATIALNDNFKVKDIFNNKKINKAVIRRCLPFKPSVVFAYRYFLKLGFLDGRLGYDIAKLSSFYEYITVLKTNKKY